MKQKTKHIKLALFLLLASFVTSNSVSLAFADNLGDNLKNYYNSDFETREELLQAGNELKEEVDKEGVVLLKNEDNALPIANNAKITVFGKNSEWRDLRTTLARDFDVNPTLVNFYKNNTLSGSGRGAAPSNGNVVAGYNTGETPVSMYRSTEIDSFADYNDAAIVVIYRMAGEGNDAARTMMWDGEQYKNWTTESTQLVPGARNTTDHYLQLDQNETDMIKLAGEHFEKVIVLLETPSSFETGFLDDPGHYAYHENIKAAMFMGMPHPKQNTQICNILKGEINPSGRITDTWARDFKLDPTWQNFGNYLMEGKPVSGGSSTVKGNQYTNLPGSGGNGGGGYMNNYVTYNEGIYVGYRYYETRGFTEGTDQYIGEVNGTTTTTWKDWYTSRVVYPLGYGLSYTTFSQEIVSTYPSNGASITNNSEITMTVKVTNTGNVSGKDVVQVYYTAPYKDGGIEKAHVVLGDFGKTKLLAPGESENIKISFSADDMASYDFDDKNKNDFKGYELESGEYVVRLMKNAHEEYENVVYKVDSDIQIANDETTNYLTENRFDETSNYITGELNQKYLSRNDWEGTWPVFNYRLTASDEVIASLKEWFRVSSVEMRDPSLDKNEPYYTTEMPVTGVDNDLILADLHQVDYDDPLWEDYMDQLSVSQLVELVTQGRYFGGANIPELGIKRVGNFDTRYGIYAQGVSEAHVYMGDIIVVANTWNKDLAYQMGRLVGDDALWTEGNGWGGSTGCGAWYAPSVNIHRSPFLGRNQQYWSEDGYFSGVMAGHMIRGAQEKGLPTYLKHFAVNNQETNRCGLITWLNEQSMREVYLKAFEICVKDYKTLGIMSSLNRIGTEWSGGSYDLLTEVLRNEWGFEGSVVTDSYLGDGSNISNADQMIRGGGNLALGTANLKYNFTYDTSTEDPYDGTGTPTTIASLRKATKGLLYLMANSNAINSFPQGKVIAIDNFAGQILNTAVVGASYSANIAKGTINKEFFPDGKDEDIVYTLADGSTLPEGLNLSLKGVISGRPTKEANNHKFIVNAEYAGFKCAGEFTISVINVNGSIVYEANQDLGSIKINEPANLNVATASIVKPNMEEGEVLPTISYSLKSGSVLPEGLTLNSDGTIIGTPTKECSNYEFTVVAKANGYSGVEFTFKLNVVFTTTFNGGTLKTGKVGESYLDRIELASSQNKVTYSLASGSALPEGLSLTGEGYIVGIPTQAVTDYSFFVSADADFADSVIKEYKISIGLAFDKRTTVMQGSVNSFYISYVSTAQGAANITYTLKDGALPNGITLSSDGILMGTPTEGGTFTFTIVASSEGKLSDEITITLYIAGGSQGLGIGGIIGISAGAIALAGAVLAFIILKKKKKDNNDNDPTGGNSKKKAIKNKKTKNSSDKKSDDDVGTIISMNESDLLSNSDKKGKTLKQEKSNERTLGVFSKIFLGLFIVQLVIILVVTQNNYLYYTLCSVLGGSEKYLVSGDPETQQHYSPDYDSKADAFKAANELNEEICEEGFVLLKNEDDVLPMKENARVTVFGKNSVNLVLGGSGSNAGSNASSDTNIYKSLESVGIEYNPVIKSYYEGTQSGEGRPSKAPNMGVILTGYPIGESPLPYPSNVIDSYVEYNDYAIVVITRVGGEGYDLPRSMFWDGKSYTNWDGDKPIPGARNVDDHYLQLDQNETDMLKEACDNFDNVIVVINSASTLELGFLDDKNHYAYNEKIKGALWIGAPGSVGINALGRILTGEVNPSGKTVDTYARNFRNDPTWYNFGNNIEKDGNRYMVDNNGKKTSINAWFVEYREGIYFGYRYYETRGFSDAETWYDQNVVYPFGYGLSYTDFEYRASSTNETELTADGKLKFNVEVTNIGNKYDGKETIQLYYSAPYIDGGIEKSHVVLGDFAKTNLISKNNGTDSVTLEIDVRDMASYDYNDSNKNGFKGYELDEGEYTIYITTNAHGWADDEVQEFKFVVPEGGFKYEKEANGTSINNLFDDVSGHIEKYLSRNNNFSNFSVLEGAFDEKNRIVSQEFRSQLGSYKINDKETDPWYSDTMPKQSSRELNRRETKTKLYDLIGKDYNDPLWDKLLDQLTVQQLSTLISTGNFRTLKIENIDKPLTIDADGPMGFAIFMGDDSVYGTCYYASETVLASTFNSDLAYRLGKMVGNEGLIGNERGGGTPYSGWYAPAMNLHRNQFGGRNFEYYSEDGYLSGVMAKNVVKGAKEKGIYTYAKHFALNEQETKRDDTGLLTWANEQSMREIYFEPFEMIVKEGKTTAMMSAFNRIGTVWAGGNYNLLTQLLRNEWGFEGMVITDFNLKNYMNTDQMIRAGGDLNLCAEKSPSSMVSATDVSSMRRAVKNILFTVANSCAMNGFGADIIWGYTVPWWVIWLLIAEGVIFITDGTLWTFYVLKRKKNLKLKGEKNEN